MGRIACAFIPRFALAVRARAVPGLWNRPIAIADLAQQRARVLTLTPAAERFGLAGLPVSEALALCPHLELLAPDPEGVRRAEEEIRIALGKLSPSLDSDGLGAFFVSADGLGNIHADEHVLAERMKSALTTLGYDARIGVADRSLPAWVAARRSPAITHVPPGQDSTAMADVPVAQLDLPNAVLERLELLGIRTVGKLAALPPGTLSSRLPEGARIERFCRGDERIAWPTHAAVPQPAEELSLDLDTPTEDLEPILFLFKSLLDRLLGRVGQARQALAELLVVVKLDDRSLQEHRLAPATATLDSRVLMDLLRLWLASGPFKSAVAAIRLVAARTEGATGRQIDLLNRQQELADDALNQAVARLSAAFGADVVVRPVLADTFRPEARLGWAPFASGPHPARRLATLSRSAGEGKKKDLNPLPRSGRGWRVCEPGEGSPSSLVLRLMATPETVNWDGHRLRRPTQARGDGTVRIASADGPRRLSGEWWSNAFDRSYFWLTGEQGEQYWLFREEGGTRGEMYLQATAD